MLMILEFVQKNLPDRHRRRENVRKGPIYVKSRQTVSRVLIRGWLFYVYLSGGTRNNASRISRNLLFSAISQECTSASTSTSMMLFHGRQSPANDHLSSEREGKKKADYIRDFSLPQQDRCSV